MESNPKEKKTTTRKSPVRRTRKKTATETQPVVAEMMSKEPAATPEKVASVRREWAQLPSRDQVARRAFEIFLARGATHGRDLDDWLSAERELSAAATVS